MEIKNITQLKELLQVGSIFNCNYHFFDCKKNIERVVEEIKSNCVKFKSGYWLYFQDKEVYSKIINNELNLYFKKDNKLLAIFTIDNIRSERIKREVKKRELKKVNCDKYLLEKYGENYISQIRKRLIDSPSSTISMFFDKETLEKYDETKIYRVINRYSII